MTRNEYFDIIGEIATAFGVSFKKDTIQADGPWKGMTVTNLKGVMLGWKCTPNTIIYFENPTAAYQYLRYLVSRVKEFELPERLEEGR